MLRMLQLLCWYRGLYKEDIKGECRKGMLGLSGISQNFEACNCCSDEFHFTLHIIKHYHQKSIQNLLRLIRKIKQRTPRRYSHTSPQTRPAKHLQRLRYAISPKYNPSDPRRSRLHRPQSRPTYRPPSPRCRPKRPNIWKPPSRHQSTAQRR